MRGLTAIGPLLGGALLGLAACAAPGLAPAGLSDGRDRADALLRVAEAANRDGDDANAAAMYRGATLARPSWAEPHIGLGRALLRQGEWQQARVAFTRAQELGGRGDVRASVGLAQAELLAGRPEAALQGFRSALAQDGRSVPASIGAGIALDRLGRHAEAQASYAAALAVDPDSRAARNNLGLSLALSGHAAEAVEVLSPLLSAEQVAPQTRENMMVALSLAGRGAEAASAQGGPGRPDEVARLSIIGRALTAGQGGWQGDPAARPAPQGL